MEEKLTMIKGRVIFAGTNEDKETGKIKKVITLTLEDSQIEKIKAMMGDTFGYEATPLKESDNGDIYFKASTSFEVKIYEDGTSTEEASNLKIEEIGKESVVQIFVKLNDVIGLKKKKFIVAYLKSINVIDYLPKEEFNPFTYYSGIEEI